MYMGAGWVVLAWGTVLKMMRGDVKGHKKCTIFKVLHRVTDPDP
jgi:hypothetical protein